MVGLGNDSPSQRNDPVFKTVGLALAISSGVFIGVSFVLKKKGLLAANEFAGKGYAYLSNGLWWSGMILMIIGEICNFVAYALTQAILVTPLGALSVVVSAICSSIFLKERLNMQGKIGCAQCIIGATIIVMHAPAQRSATNIDEFQALCLSPGFLTYAIVCIISSGLIIWRLGPTYGSKNMLVYISVCSIIGSLSVVTTQGLGIAIIRTIQGDNQFAITHWFLYFLIAFIIVTLLTEINFLNKALNLFNTAMVTPVYYVIFTSLTMLSSSILTQGFQAPPASVVTVILGFLVICSGIVLLQTSKGISVDASGTTVLTTVSKDSDLESGSTLNNKNSLLLRVSFIEPGASEIRASFGSIKRYSMNFDPQHKDFATFPYDQSTSKISPNVKKTIRLGHQTKRSMSMPDPTILNEFIEKTEEDEKKSYGLRSFTRKLKLLSPTTPTTPFPTTSAMPTTTASFSSSVNRKEKIGSKKVIAPIITTTPPTTSVDYHRQYSPSLPTRPSSSLSPPSSPSPSSPPLKQQSRSRPQSQSQTNNNDNNNEIDFDNNNHHQQQHNHHIDILSLPSPLQHPINYIRQHLSPTNTSFIDNDSSSRRIDPKTL